MRFLTPCNCSNSGNNFISSKIQFTTNISNGYQSVISTARIPANETILI